jgi:uncharacterized protein
MVNKILLPQEVETFYIIPTLRKHFAINLKERGLKQKDIAEILMINTSAISQYNAQKRGNQIQLNEEIKQAIKKSTKNIKDNITYLKETQKILRLIRTTKQICSIHKQFSVLPNNCDPEIIGCKNILGV